MIDYLDSFAINFWAEVTKGSLPNDCWKWKASKDRGGYGRLGICVKGKTVNQAAHRVSYALHNPDFNSKLCVLHRCDNPECCNPMHLFVGTHSDNTRDMLKKARSNRAKLTEAQVVYIYTNITRYKPATLATRFNVSQVAISRIKHKFMWKEVTDQIDKKALLTKEEKDVLS